MWFLACKIYSSSYILFSVLLQNWAPRGCEEINRCLKGPPSKPFKCNWTYWYGCVFSCSIVVFCELQVSLFITNVISMEHRASGSSVSWFVMFNSVIITKSKIACHLLMLFKIGYYYAYSISDLMVCTCMFAISQPFPHYCISMCLIQLTKCMSYYGAN